MKAIVCRHSGNPLQALSLEELPSPQAAPGQIVLDVKAAGVNFPDILMVQGKYQRKLPFPFTPGMEVAGIVTAVGRDVEGFAPGDHVCAHVRQGGAFAEKIAIEVNYAVARIPAAIDFQAAAAFPLAYGTAFEALKDRATLRDGETVLVLGAAGGVGMAVVQIAKILGAKVIACASSDERLRACRHHGADELINYETQDLRLRIRELTAGRGIDVVCDQVGGRFTEPALKEMAMNGRYCVIGFAAGVIPSIPLNLVLLKGSAIVGIAVGMNAVRGNSTGYRANLLQLIDWIAAGRLQPVVTAAYPLKDTAQALDDLMQRRVWGKVVIVP